MDNKSEHSRFFEISKSEFYFSENENNFSKDKLKVDKTSQNILFTKFTDDLHIQFIFILYVNINFLDKRSNDKFEIWDMPASNSNNNLNLLNEVILNNFIINENNINKSFPFISPDIKRNMLISITECSNLNSLENKIYINNLEVIKKICDKTFLVIKLTCLCYAV